mgnify:CR=1 FL=1
MSVAALSSYSFVERADERRRRCVLRGERVRLELVPARIQRRERRQNEREHRQREEEQDQRDTRAIHGGRYAQSFVEPRRRGEPCEEREKGERRRGHPQHALQHVLQLEVAELVREHRLHLVRRQAFEQRVEEHDALRASESGEERVAVARAAGSVHHEQAAIGEIAAGEQRLDRVTRRAFGQWRELVEERRDHGRVERQQQKLEGDPRGPGPEPPQRSRGAHQPHHERRQRQAERGADGHPLREIGEPQLRAWSG